MQSLSTAETATSSSSENQKDDSNNISTIFLPSKFAKCSRTDLAVLISRMLTFLIRINDSSASSSSDGVPGLTRFHSRVPPDISVYNYLIRLTKYSSLEHSVLLTAVYYIDLLSSVYPIFTLNSLTVHRFLLTATTIASKGLCDSFCTNTHYAKVGGVHSSELNILECEFLKRVNYRILPRDNNINWCKLESKYHVFSLYNEPGADIANLISNPSTSHNNSGYDVLDIYFHKIVQLVGSYDASPDKSKVVNYALRPFSSKEATEVGSIMKESSATDHGHSTSAIADSKMKHTESSGLPRKRNLEAFGPRNHTTDGVFSEQSKPKKQSNSQRTPKFTYHTDL